MGEAKRGNLDKYTKIYPSEWDEIERQYYEEIKQREKEMKKTQEEEKKKNIEPQKQDPETQKQNPQKEPEKPEETQKRKIKMHNTLQELITNPERRGYVKKRLPYKMWNLFIFKGDDRYTIRITSRRGNKYYIKLSIDYKDIKYLKELLEELENQFKKLGLTLSQI
ncbi:MAG: hypothetical protein QXQ36_07170 [Sulfolobales archaeon]